MEVKERGLISSESPETDESFVGYLLRLTELNRYEKLSWVLQLAHIGHPPRFRRSFALNRPLDLSHLMGLTGVDETKLVSLLYAPVGESDRGGRRDYSVFGNPVPGHIIRLNKPKVCPKCLRESNYARKIWELAPVTVCPLHGCLLIDECPFCGRPISWNRKGISLCDCGSNWSEYEPPCVGDSELLIGRQIHWLCKLAKEDSSKESPLPDSNALRSLELRHLVSALIFIASQYAGMVDTKGKQLFTRRRNDEVHGLLCKALLVFEDWPTNFYSFLDWRRERSKDTQSLWGTRKEFEQFRATLYNQFRLRQFGFMRGAFEEYLVTKWDGGYVNHMKRLDENARSKSKYVSKSETKILLGLGSSEIDDLVSEGRLKAVIRKHESSNLFLIERAGVLDLKSQLDQSLNLKQAARRLGIPRERVRELAASGLLTPLQGLVVNGQRRWKYSEVEIEQLLKRVKDRIVKPARPLAVEGLISFHLSSRILSRAGIRIGESLKSILDGKVRPYGENEKPGLAALLFERDELQNFIRCQRRSSLGKSFTVGEVGKKLGVVSELIYLLIRKGILHSYNHPKGMLITNEDFKSFNSTYVIFGKVVRRLGTHPGMLAKLLKGLGIIPVSGPGVDEGRQYIFKKADLKNINLAKLISNHKTEQSLNFKRRRLLDHAQAAEVLGVDSATLDDLVIRGILKYRNPRATEQLGDCNYFWLKTILLYKKRGIDYTGLVLLSAAANILGLSPNCFISRYVRTKRLRVALSVGPPYRRYFLLKDVLAIADLDKETVSAPKAAEICGVNISAVHKWTVDGTLKPISGPRVNGFGINLYLRRDVERLHAERESFKAERTVNGGTARFGKQAGPRFSPVQDAISPRIEQLIREWNEQAPDQRITGERLHQRLINEGYKVGINTVYVCLRQRYLSSAKASKQIPTGERSVHP